MSNPDFAHALVLTGGGTGGHFFPAVALAEGAQGPLAGAEGGRSSAPGGASRRGAVSRRGPGRTCSWTWRASSAAHRSASPGPPGNSGGRCACLKRLWREQRPWAVIGTGGYGAAPALLAARSLGIPFFLHESNAAPGALVRLVAPRARRVWCGMEAVRGRLPERELSYGGDARAAGLSAGLPTRGGEPSTLLPAGAGWAAEGPGPSTRP